jgi:hypothetical protein
VAGQVWSDHGVGSGQFRNEVSPRLSGAAQSVDQEQGGRPGSGEGEGEIATRERNAGFDGRNDGRNAFLMCV